MLKHIPLGIGHPYRTEPFERTPHYPTSEDIIVLRVIAPQGTAHVTAEIHFNGNIEIVPMKNSGAAKSVDLGAYGETAKEISNDTHLQDAAIRSGEYESFDCWELQLEPVKQEGELKYRFSSPSTQTDFFDCPLHFWDQKSKFPLISNIENGLIGNKAALVDAEGTVRKIRFSVAIAHNERVVGFGERFNTICQKNQTVDAVVYEEYKGQGSRTYLPVPFFHALTSKFALHVVTSTRTYFDINQKAGQIVVEVEISPSQKELHLDLFFGDAAKNLDSYLHTVGKPKNVPSWIFSLWISSNEWNTQNRVMAEFKACIDSGIRPGVVVIEAWSDESTFTVFRDAIYKVTDGFEGLRAEDITYPPDGAWPDPHSMIETLHAAGTKLILWQIPVIKEIGTPGSQAEVNWKAAVENDFVVRDEGGDPYRVRGFWFQDGLLPDLSNEEVRKWWTEQRRYLVEDLGVDGFKTDGGEHAWGSGLVYKDQKLGIEKNNTFPMHYAQAFHELFERLGKEPLTFSRAGFTGSQAFPAFWAGDENSTWAAFRASIRAGITASASGFFHWGWDIGGFSGDIPSPELYLRGAAMATFCPIMQIHSEFNHHKAPSNDRTPWNLAARHQNPELLKIFSELSSLREKLAPYLVESSNDAIANGRPMMAGLFFDYPDDERIWDFEYQYMLGRDLLVCPVTEPGVDAIEIYLPSGDWYDFWTGEKFDGETTHIVKTSINTIPVFSKNLKNTKSELTT